MTPFQVQSEIRTLTECLLGHSLATLYNFPVIDYSGKDSIVTWSGNARLSESFDLLPSVDQYLSQLNGRQYTIVLADWSLLQMSYVFRNGKVLNHHLSYYPCPLVVDPTLPDDFSVIDLLELLSSEEFKTQIRLEGPLRFDYDPIAEKLNHPASHLTISRSCCRIPVFAPLSIGHFIKFLFMHFYPEWWETVSQIQTWACFTGDNCLPSLADDHMYLHWQRKK